ncbi:hypothetical protein D3C83_102460 [compost metagenome]
MCQTGFSICRAGSSSGYLARKVRYSSTFFGITSKYSRFAAVGLPNMNSARLSFGA